MKIISWNVNGLRAILKKDFIKDIISINPDVICLQEIKVSDDVIPEINLPGYHKFYNCATRRGYSGTAIFSKIEPISVDTNTVIDNVLSPPEGRVVVVEFNDFFVVNVYTMNSGSELARLNLRSNTWDVEFSSFLKTLNKPVIVCGDLNVAHNEIDLSNPQFNHFNAGFTDEERLGFNNLLKNNNLIDSFRYFYPDKANQYTWWSYRASSRSKNIGWRIDYCLVSMSLISRVQNVYIFNDIIGSDHCPVGINVKQEKNID